MKLSKIVLGMSLAFGIVSFANADQGSGTVTIKGSIIDAPCSIAPESIDQTLDLGQISSAALLNQGKSTTKTFDIKLESCTFGTPATKNKLTVTFDGIKGVRDNSLALSGTAKGASIMMFAPNGDPIELGKATTAMELSGAKSNLTFSAYLQGDTASGAVTEGDFKSTANFTLAYQ